MILNSNTHLHGEKTYRSTLKLAAKAALVTLGLGLITAAGAQRASWDTIKVFVDGDRVHFEDVGPQQIDGRIMVPVRGVLEKVGANVDWTPETQRVNCSSGDIDIVLHIGEKRAKVNGQFVQLDVAAQTIGGHTMVPLRFLSESLGAKVRWDGQENTVFIMTPDAGKHLGDRTRKPDGDLPRDADHPRRDGDRKPVSP